jgi:hypothetical protein
VLAVDLVEHRERVGRPDTVSWNSSNNYLTAASIPDGATR